MADSTGAEKRSASRELHRIEAQVGGARQRAVDLLAELVAVPTANPPGERYLECALLLAERLREMGFEPRLVEVPPHELQRLNLPADGPRPSVLAELGAEAPGVPALHFHGHYDVVPAEHSGMFRLHIAGDVARGRGTADMKGGLVSLLLAMEALRPFAARLRGRVQLSLVPDEETGGEAGTGYLFRCGALQPGGLGMLTPEPTGGVVWNGNRGAISLRLRVGGRTAHVAFQDQGQNAFEGMLELGAMLRELKHAVESRRFGEDRLGLSGPPSILLLGGICRGGTNFNVVPDDVQFSIDRRFHPEESMEGVERELETLFRRFRRKGWPLEVHSLQRGAASLTPADAPLARLMRDVVSGATGRAPEFVLCPGILETRFFLAHGTPGLAYGPGELELSHTRSECVSIPRILEVARIYARMAWQVLGAK